MLSEHPGKFQLLKVALSYSAGKEQDHKKNKQVNYFLTVLP
jgi:hypothetical protein